MPFRRNLIEGHLCDISDILQLFFLLMLSGCEQNVINSPYSIMQTEDKILYSSFTLRPKHLDPARSYSSNEALFTGQIYEPPLQYHYLKRPYTLEPLTATSMPNVVYLNEQGQQAGSEDTIAYSVYTIELKQGIQYQPHPAFSRNQSGEYRYHNLTTSQAKAYQSISDFEFHGTRELTAADYVHQIKRLAHPNLHSPILGLMSNHIVGLSEFSKQLRQQTNIDNLDLRDYEIDGVEVLDKYRYQIKVYGKYPQLNYWLAMPFFAPMPWEADVFYHQHGLASNNITLDWYPVGTGPFYLSKNDPNSQMVLTKNPNYHTDFYPDTGEAEDIQQGLLNDAGKPLPLIDKVVFTLEKENISYWNKFLQGYYDVSGLSSDSFEQAIDIGDAGNVNLNQEMKEKGIQLKTSIATSIFYIGFNMMDPVVGGLSEQAKLLRQAVSIAIDYEEYISIFANGRGIAAQGPIPPGIFGYELDEHSYNNTVYKWGNRGLERRTIEEAKERLAQAGYPNGRDQNTGEPLTLYFDVPASGVSAKAQYDWLRKQFKKLNIQLVVRSTDYNRFQDKMRTGQAQLFQWGWNADYPDPENFLFLLYGNNGKVKSGGENAANYNNSEFDYLFEQMRTMPNNAQRAQVIDEMQKILVADAPWVWGWHPKEFSLFHSWNANIKPNLMANNTLKYRSLDVEKRAALQQRWNTPIFWPLLLLLVGLILVLLPAWFRFRQKCQQRIIRS